jgi:hypothetical protein
MGRVGVRQDMMYDISSWRSVYKQYLSGLFRDPTEQAIKKYSKVCVSTRHGKDTRETSGCKNRSTSCRLCPAPLYYRRKILCTENGSSLLKRRNRISIAGYTCARPWCENDL